MSRITNFENFHMVGNTRTRSDIKREAIIQAATQAFQEFGVKGTSMD